MGHLFVAHGDLTKLACDAVLIPCDAEGWVTPAWRSLLPRDCADEEIWMVSLTQHTRC